MSWDDQQVPGPDFSGDPEIEAMLALNKSFELTLKASGRLAVVCGVDRAMFAHYAGLEHDESSNMAIRYEEIGRLLKAAEEADRPLREGGSDEA